MLDSIRRDARTGDHPHPAPRRRAWRHTALVGALFAFFACGGATCDNSGGVATLEFRQRQGCAGSGAVILQKTATGVTQASWGPPTLAPVTNTPASEVVVRFSDTFSARPFGSSAMLFGYDPSSSAEQLQGLLLDDAAWGAIDDRCSTSTGVWFRGPDGGTSPTEIGLAFTPLGGGGCPAPVSVQAASIYERGLCATGAYFDDGSVDEKGKPKSLFPIIADALWQGFYEKANANDCADAERRFLHLGSYVTFGAGDPNYDRRGGFVLHFDFGTDINAPVKNNNVYFNYSYEFQLNDGILDLTATEDGRFVNGFNHGSLGDELAGNLRDELPKQVRAKAESAQTRAIPFFGGSCTQSSPGDDRIPADSDQCSGARSAIRDAMKKLNGDASLTSQGFPAGGGDRLAALVDQADESGKLKNLRCVSAGTTSQCELVLRAKRLLVYPDEVELVWLDSFKDVDTTGAVGFYLTRILKATDQLCSDPTATGSAGIAVERPHPIAILSRGFDRRDASGGILAGPECIGSQLLDFVKSHSWLGSSWVLR